jgi:hypothetical protein
MIPSRPGLFLGSYKNCKARRLSATTLCSPGIGGSKDKASGVNRIAVQGLAGERVVHCKPRPAVTMCGILYSASLGSKTVSA